MRHQEVIYGVSGQSFTFDPPEWLVPSTPTLQVFAALTDDDGTAESATTGSCSVDTLAATLSVAAVRGDQSLSVAIGAGAFEVGRRYLIQATNGVREVIDVQGYAAGTLSLERPLANSYAIATPISGCRISCSVSNTWAATKSKLTDLILSTNESIRTDIDPDRTWPAGATGYRLRWLYTISGVQTVSVSFADLVRYPLKNHVLPADVNNRYAGWIDALPIDHQSDNGRRLIAQAFEDVRLDALGDAQVMRRIRESSVIHGLTVDRALMNSLELQLSRGADVERQLAAARDIYSHRYNQLLRAPKVPVDQTGGGSSAAARPLPLWRR